jgi:NADPH:quinone reductase-like Zn-dependent oxidoreductase
MSLFNAPKSAFDEIHAAILEGLSDGSLIPVIDQTFPLADAPASHEAIIGHKAQGKIVLQIG